MRRRPAPEARPSKPPPREADLLVAPTDLARIDIVQGLLSTLNDPRASAVQLVRHIQQSLVLSSRIEARFRQRHANREVPGLGEQIALLGNREIESVLFELLEDLVVLHSESKDGG
jgi:hypothetical protein